MINIDSYQEERLTTEVTSWGSKMLSRRLKFPPFRFPRGCRGGVHFPGSVADSAAKATSTAMIGALIRLVVTVTQTPIRIEFYENVTTHCLMKRLSL